MTAEEESVAGSPKALEGVRVLDLTHVQSGPSCTQLLAWLGADVIKIEIPGRGDITRSQLRDIPGVDSLYFTMLNANKRSVTLNLKSDEGRRVMSELVQRADVLVENFGPGALARQGFSWERLQELNPRLIAASIKGFGAGPFGDAKAYEPIAQAVGGSMSTSGFADGPPMVTGAQIGDSGTGIHLTAAILAALVQRDRHTGRGQQVLCTMQDSILNLCRVKFRDQQRLDRGPLPEYPVQSLDGAVPRAGNASGGGHPGAALRCAPAGANDYVYLIVQPQVWEPLCTVMDRPDLVVDPEFATPERRLVHLDEVFGEVEKWTMEHTKDEVYKRLNAAGVPCGPILDTQELMADDALRARKMIATIDHPERGPHLTIGSPLQLADSPVDYRPAPLLGEHTDEVLREVLGYDDHRIAALRDGGVV